MTDIMTASVPSHWEIKRLGQLFRERKQKVSDADFPPLSVTKNGIVPQLDTAAKSDDGDNRKGVLPGDFVINSRSDRKGSSGLSKLRGSVSLINMVLEPRGLHPRFGHHLLRSPAFQEEFYRWGHGIVADLWTTRYFDMKNIRMGIPSPSEQAAIADFLDNETARIDRMIETKTRMLAALAERKDSAAIMCLSDGVDAFEWQPDKQEFAFRFKRPGWTAMRVKAVVSFMTSGSRGWSGLLGTEGEAFIQSGNIGRMMEVDVSSAQRVAPQVGAEAKRTRVRKHDVLVCITGGRTGAVGYVRSIDERAYINQHVCLLRARSQVLLPELLAQLLWSDLGQKQFGQRQYGVKQGIGFNELADLIVPVPCPEAQPHLVERINTETAKLDKLMLALQASIDRLNELRGSIITATVTGTLDISAWRKGNMTQRQLATVEAGT